MPDKTSHTSYNIVDDGNGNYRFFASKMLAYEGHLAGLFVVTVNKFDIRFEEVELAVLEIVRTGKPIAEFGVYGTFMFTLTYEEAELAA
jgi:hypothetical protein